MEPAPKLHLVEHRLNVPSLSNTPIPGAGLHYFRGVKFPEAVLVLPATSSRPGVAMTTDAVQNHTSVYDWDNSALGRLARHLEARPRGRSACRLGPFWMRQQVPPGPGGPGTAAALLRPQYEALLAMDWDVLVPGHGWPVPAGARSAPYATAWTPSSLWRGYDLARDRLFKIAVNRGENSSDCRSTFTYGCKSHCYVHAQRTGADRVLHSVQTGRRSRAA